MPKKTDFRLSDEKIAEIEDAIKKDKRPEVRQKAMAIQLLHLGHKAEEIASMLGVSKPSVYGWHNRWQAEGIEGLANRPKKPRRRKANEAYCQALDAALEQEPEAFGYSFAIWTTERLRDHLESQTGIRLSVNWLNEIIRQRGYVYRRPKHDLTNLQDLTAKQQAAELLEELKKGRSKTISGFSLWTKRP
jgi:transposase